MAARTLERISFGRIKEVIAPPNLIEVQVNSYKEFLQADMTPSRRKNMGLQAVFTEVFPDRELRWEMRIGFSFLRNRRRPRLNGLNACAKA